MDKKGKILSLYWFAILFMVAAGISYMAVSFYGAPYDVRGIEADILADKIANCLAEGGYLKENIFSEEFKNNFLEECHITFKTENEHGWNKEEQYYLEVNFYKFDQNVPNALGEKILGIEKGNVNLKNIATLEEGLKKKWFEKKRDINMIVIHYTATESAEDAIETLRERGLSVHYMIDKDGLIISSGNEENIVPKGFLERKAFKEENKKAEHAGCVEKGEEREKCPEECINERGLLKQECKFERLEACCIDVNERSIGIELVNLGYLCGTEFKSSCYEQGKGVEAKGKIWENFTEEQINSLVFLVSDIASRYNIPIDREHILGHEEVAPGYKLDPGEAFPWNEFMERLESEERISPYAERSFYVIDRQGNQYVIKILALVKKTEKNVV